MFLVRPFQRDRVHGGGAEVTGSREQVAVTTAEGSQFETQVY